MEGNFRDGLNSWIFIFFFLFFLHLRWEWVINLFLSLESFEINEKNISLIGCYNTDHRNEKSSKMNIK